MGFGDKKEAWEESVNMKQDELGSIRPALLTAERDDRLMPFVNNNLKRGSDVKTYLYILKDGPIVKDGVRYERWLYFKAFGADGIRGYYIYDNGTDTPDVR